MTKLKRVPVYLDQELYEHFRILAKESRMSLSMFLKQCGLRYAKDQAKLSKQLEAK